MLLETMKKQYLAMIQTMQSKQYSDNIIKEIEREKAKKESLQKRIKQLETQIDGLIKDSLKLLKARISRLGVETESPLEFIKHANTIVSSHSQLLEKRDGLEEEIKRLEQEQKQLVERKEKELLEQLISQRSGGDVNLSELRSYVQREIWNCLESRSSGSTNTTIQPVIEMSRATVHASCNTQDTPMTTSTGGPLPKLSSEVTLTKVGAPEKLKDKDKDNSFTLPRMELKLPGENSYSYAEERRGDHQERNHVIDNRNGGKSNSLGLSDDYEDRVKMIITSELAREGDKKMSPVKDTKMMQEPGRRNVQNGPSPTSRGRIDSDPRYQPDYRSSAGSGGIDYRYNNSSGLPPDSRYRSSGGMSVGVPHDLRRTPSDPRLISPHSGISPIDSRLISPHDRRLISPHQSSMPADGRLVSPHSSEPHHPSSSSYSSSRRSAPSPLDVRAVGGSGPPPPRSSYMDRPHLGKFSSFLLACY